MSVSAHYEPPSIRLSLSEEQNAIICKAAELQGWTVSEYIVCALLDRAERDLYEHAARTDWERVYPATSAEPITSVMELFGEV